MENSTPIVNTEQGKALSAAELQRRSIINNTGHMGDKTPQTTLNRSVGSTTPQDIRKPGVSKLVELAMAGDRPGLYDALVRHYNALGQSKVQRANTSITYSADHPRATVAACEWAGETVPVIEYPEALIAALIRLAEAKTDGLEK